MTVAICALFAQFFVRQNIYVPGDATATAQNIVAAPRGTEPVVLTGMDQGRLLGGLR